MGLTGGCGCASDVSRLSMSVAPTHGSKAACEKTSVFCPGCAHADDCGPAAEHRSLFRCAVSSPIFAATRTTPPPERWMMSRARTQEANNITQQKRCRERTMLCSRVAALIMSASVADRVADEVPGRAVLRAPKAAHAPARIGRVGSLRHGRRRRHRATQFSN